MIEDGQGEIKQELRAFASRTPGAVEQHRRAALSRHEIIQERPVLAAPGYQARCGSLATHPYNRDQPHTTTWWLFPAARRGGNWPAYHRGKFMYRLRAAGSQLFTGLHVEKGIGEALARALGRRTIIILRAGSNP
ncbi:MAG: hypothetical protein JG766_2669 [Desulfacinum sp.]|jgi:hypothetical protein|nr:hypothetical protein [Desulfacinum sp.]